MPATSSTDTSLKTYVAKFNLRLPGLLKRELEECARQGHRSLNQEIVYRLRQSLSGYTR